MDMCTDSTGMCPECGIETRFGSMHIADTHALVQACVSTSARLCMGTPVSGARPGSVGHNYISHNYISNNYISHNYISHDYIGRNNTGMPSWSVVLGLAASARSDGAPCRKKWRSIEHSIGRSVEHSVEHSIEPADRRWSLDVIVPVYTVMIHEWETMWHVVYKHSGIGRVTAPPISITFRPPVAFKYHLGHQWPLNITSALSLTRVIVAARSNDGACRQTEHADRRIVPKDGACRQADERGMPTDGGRRPMKYAEGQSMPTDGTGPLILDDYYIRRTL